MSETTAPDRPRATLLAIRQALGEWQPPLERRQFWFVQGLVLLIAVGHLAIEALDVLGDHTPLNLMPPVLFLVPVVYAALEFGLRGALLTAIWSCALVVPNLLLWHPGVEGIAESLQMAWVVMVAIFVGIGVDHERQARLDAQEREEARRRSERRYRDIFDAVAEPIVVLDSRRLVDAANFAALRLFGLDMDGILHRPLPGTLGEEIAAYLDARDDGQASTRLVRSLDPPAWIEPIVMTVQGADGLDQLQLLLLDVTTSHERERGLEEIARQTMQAREEEGRRIARELHDGPLQTLVALWRLLDGIESEQRPPGPTLERARTLTRSIAEELRRVSRDLRPSILDDLGLIAAVRSECDAFAERSRLVIEVAVTGSIRRLDPTLELALLRILQEAFRNIDSHAHATSVSVDVVFGPDDIRLSIADDGTGLDPIPSTTELLAADHLGLIGMRERARVSGAELSLRAVPHGGLMVEVTARTGGPRASSRG